MLGHGRDIDYFAFAAGRGQTYRIDVDLGTLDDSVAALFDSRSRELDFDDDGGESFGSRLTWTAAESGIHYVAVAGWGDTGSYTLTVTAVGAQPATPSGSPPEPPANQRFKYDGLAIVLSWDASDGADLLHRLLRRLLRLELPPRVARSQLLRRACHRTHGHPATRMPTPTATRTTTGSWPATASAARPSTARTPPGSPPEMTAVSKAIVRLLLGIAALAILLVGCSDEPDAIRSNGADSRTRTSSEQGANPEPTHASASAVTNTAAPEAAGPTPTALPTTPATPAATATAAVPEAATPAATVPAAVPEAATPAATATAAAPEAATPAATATAAAPEAATPAATATAAAPKTRSAREFASVSAGEGHTCGVRRDGSVECWGSDSFGPGHAPVRRVFLRQRG